MTPSERKTVKEIVVAVIFLWAVATVCAVVGRNLVSELEGCGGIAQCIGAFSAEVEKGYEGAKDKERTQVRDGGKDE